MVAEHNLHPERAQCRYSLDNSGGTSYVPATQSTAQSVGKGRELRRFAAIVYLVAASLSGTALATTASGALVGTVFDPTGAVIAAATVELRNQATGLLRMDRSNDVGEYNFVLLPPGVYDLTIRATGFRDALYGGIKVDVDEVARVNLTLEVAGATSALTISGEPPLLDTETSGVGQVVQHTLIEGLPLNERNYINFTLLGPGAHTPVAGSQASTMGPGAVSVNGAREQANTFLLDGVDNNNLLINRTTVVPPIDAIEEFKVQSSTYSAEYGRSGGAQINLVLKSGSNKLHGSVFEFFRNRVMDAKNYFDLPDCKAGSPPGTCGAIPRYQRSQFGGTLGGPIQRNRSFFFVAYEGLALRQATTRQSTVPSQTERSAVLSAIPPFLQNPAGIATLNLYPAANTGSDLTTSTRFVAAPVIRNSVNEGVVKFDDALTSHDQISAHYAVYDANTYLPYDVGFTVSNLPGFGDYHISRGQNLGINWIHSFNPSASNELRFGFNRDRLAVLQQNQGINRSAQLGYPSPANPLQWGYPNAQITGFETLGEPFQAPEDNYVNTFHVADNFVWLPQFDRGRHHFHFGGDFRRLQDNGYADFYSRGIWIFLGVTGSSLQDLVLGLPAVALVGSGNSHVNLRSFSPAVYGEDTFRVTPNLTLNLGLRYEYNSAPVDAHNHLSTPDLSSNSLACTPQPDCQFLVGGSHGVPRSIYTTSKTNFAPRLGFAWTPLPSGHLVVRSGYGIYYDVPILDVNILMADNPPFYQLRYNINDGTKSIQTIVASPLNQIISLTAARNFHDPYYQQWNLGLEYQLASNLVLDTAYVGSKGTHLIGFSDTNQSEPGGPHPYPQFGSIGTMDTLRSSTYHALEARLEQRPWHGATYVLAYTWSKSIDNGSEFLGSSTEGQYAQDAHNLSGERGLSGFDARHRLVFSYVWDLPFGPGGRYLDRNDFIGNIVRNWHFSGILSLQSGQPFTVNRVGYQSFTTLITGTDRPDLIADPFVAGPVMGNPHPACHSTISQGGLAADRTRTVQTWVNPCAYSDPNLLHEFRFGTAPRNQVIGPGLAQLDLSLNRTIRLGERYSLYARVDVFNIFNHPNFDPPVRFFDSQNFSSLFSANAFGSRPPRQIQLALKFQF